jgi:membrane-associated phospholipid phosphatase
MAGALFSEDPIRALQGLSSPVLDYLFISITYTGGFAFLLTIAVLVYWLGSKRTGLLLAVALLSSAALNGVLKSVFGMPRPPQELHMVQAGGNGFPSGHAQQSTTFWSSLALVRRGVWAFIAPPMILLVALSRVYLGVHFVGDVLGGFAFGMLVSVLAVAAFKSRLWERLGLREKLVLAFVLPAVFPGSLLLLGMNVVGAWGLLTGIAVGYLLEAEWVAMERPRRWESILIRLSIGIPVLGGLYALGWRLENAVMAFAFHIVLGLMAALILPWIFGMAEAFILRRTPEEGA